MFDMGFFELLLIAVVGLLVIGPERLPGAVRSGGLWVGRIKRMMRETRAGLEEQIGADDIRRQLHNEDVMRSLQSSSDNIKRAVSEEGFEADLAEDYEQDRAYDSAYIDKNSDSSDDTKAADLIDNGADVKVDSEKNRENNQ